MAQKFNLRDIGKAFRDTFKSFGEHKITKLSSSLAYYTVFSMGPLLIMIISLCGLFLEREAVEGKIQEQLAGFVGSESADQLQDVIRNASLAGKSKLAVIIGSITLLLGATTVFAEIQDSINSIWGLKAKPKKGWLKMLKNRVLSFSIIVSLGFLLLVSLAISTLVDVLNDSLNARFPDVAVAVLYIVNLLVTFIITTTIFAVIFKVLPDAKIQWQHVWAGAIITAILFMIGKLLISLYISRANIGNTYGAAGSLVIFILWVYYSSMILYLGALFTKQYAMIRGQAIMPSRYAVKTETVPAT